MAKACEVCANSMAEDFNHLNLIPFLLKLEAELKEHPRTGTGKPEPLSGDRGGQWSRRISKKHYDDK